MSNLLLGGLIGYSVYSFTKASEEAKSQRYRQAELSADRGSPSRVLPASYGAWRREQIDQRVRNNRDFMGPDQQIKFYSHHPLPSRGQAIS